MFLRLIDAKFTVSKCIGRYGPYKLASEFLFSNFRDWSTGHNRGFNTLVAEARGKICILDVGAHIGLTSLPMSTVVGQGGKVYAFEPGIVNLGFLKQHVLANAINNIEIIGSAVGQEDKIEIEFFEHKLPSGMNSTIGKGDKEHRRKIVVPMTTLDSYCMKYALQPELLKIDVEGAEMDVLLGAENMIGRCLPDIFLSVHPRELKLVGVDVSILRKLIDRLGYDIYDPESGERFDGELKFSEYQLLSRRNN